MNLSYVVYYAERESSRCGYCNSPNSSFRHGMWAHRLMVRDYQVLIDRGWRRSGKYCYKPTMERTCCPMYTIKCKALEFQISKSQKKILKHMARFLRNDLKKERMDVVDDHLNRIDIDTEEIRTFKKHLKLEKPHENIANISITSMDSSTNDKLCSTVPDKNEKWQDTNSEQKTLGVDTSDNKEDILNVNSEKAAVVEPTKSDISKKPCRKAKQLRIERKRNKLLAQGKTEKEVEAIMKESKRHNNPKNFDKLFEEVFEGTQKLEMKLVQVRSEEFNRTLDVSASLYKKYQMAVHGDPPEECTKETFYNFLVDSPLMPCGPKIGTSHGYGSFHEQYWLNNELIAVAVIDILPSCVSSVYFFYDPAYSQLSLGTFSSLREIYLVRQLNKNASGLKYYYMGYYIHSCPKMRYKAKLKPSELLCPETYTWCDIVPSLVKLNKQKYCRLNDDLNASDTNGRVDINQVKVLFDTQPISFRIYKMLSVKDITEAHKMEIEEYAKLVGNMCVQNLVLCR